MTPEQWRKAKEVFHAALEVTAEERPALLARACSGDAELRARVERMLAADAKEHSVIDRPAIEGVAQLFKREEAPSMAGRMFDRYRIERELGRGGMGQVYLATDTVLNRPVAFKLLPETFSRHPERVRRFQQEARAVSALNHPNIITIHEIGETDGLRFIITEYVDGETLRDIIVRGERDLTQVIRIVIQVAEALVAAHSAGIIHRDIKPENIMVRGDGYVKVLDFGLAKSTEEQNILSDRARQLSYQVVSTPGLVLGTVNYMSPEQARGHNVDARTDIFSLGVVLYEAITGRPPFEGRTAADLLLAIAVTEPPPITAGIPAAPARLQQIIDRALRKNCDERYQTIGEMERDLEEVRSILPMSSRQQSRPGAAAIATSTTSSAEYLISSIKRHGIGAGIAALLSLILLTASAFGLYRLLAGEKRPPLDPAKLRFTKLTTVGNAFGVISPDGKYVLYSQNSGLVIKQLATGNTTQISPPRPDYANYGNVFSPDSNYVYAWFQERASPDNNFLERVSLVPGPSQRVLDRVNHGFSFSPDGRRIAFSRGDNQMTELVLANSDGSNEQVLAIHRAPAPWIRAVAWSPDGNLIALSTTVDQDPGQNQWGLTGVRVDNRAEINLSAQHWRTIRNFAWLPDGTGLVISAVDRAGNTEALWLVPYPTGNPQRLTPELSSFQGVSISSDGSKIVTNQSDQPANIWQVPLAEGSQAVRLTASNAAYGSLDWTPDGRIVYEVVASARGSDLWVMAADGSNTRQLTFGSSANVNLHVSPDGRYIVFASNRAGGFSLWRMNLDGSEVKQLTTGTRDNMPVFTPDGQSVIYESTVNDNRLVFNRVSIDGGTPTQIGETNLNSSVLAISPDGQRLAFWRRSEPHRRVRTVIQSLADGTIQQELDSVSHYDLQWSPDGTGLLYTDGSNVWRQPFSGGPPKRLTNFTSDLALRFSLSRDGKSLAVVQGNFTSDVVLISAK